MRYFVPDLALASLLPAQTHLEEKRGGLPWGLPPERWPLCANCGKPQSLLAQLVHHPERLDLGAEGRNLFAFQCNHDPVDDTSITPLDLERRLVFLHNNPQKICPTWNAASGANACFVLDAAELGSGLVHSPGRHSPAYLEARVTRWLERDDGIPPELAPCFFDEKKRCGLPDKIESRLPGLTKLGSVPAYIQSADEGPRDGWRFVGQLDSSHSFFSPVPTPDEIGCTVVRQMKGNAVGERLIRPKPGAPDCVWVDADRYHGRNWMCHGLDFGDAGIGYLFLKDQPTKPQGLIFWQCG